MRFCPDDRHTRCRAAQGSSSPVNGARRNYHLCLQGVPGAALRTVSDRLGHARVTTTMDLYTFGLVDADRQAAEDLEGSIFGIPSQNPPTDEENRPW